jgi:hypothetical protein
MAFDAVQGMVAGDSEEHVVVRSSAAGETSQVETGLRLPADLHDLG